MLMSFEPTLQALQVGNSEHRTSFRYGGIVGFFVAFNLLGCFVCVRNFSKGCITASNSNLLSSQVL